MKEIIINEDNIEDSEVTDTNIIENCVFINDNKVLLKSHHNSYYFIHKDELNKSYEVEPFLVKKIYEEDYPFIGDNTLLIKNFYLIKEKIDIKDSIWICLNDVITLLKEKMYDNPRVQDVTKEIIEVIEYLLTILN